MAYTDPEKRRAYRRQYYAAHIQEERACQKASRERHKDKRRLRDRERYWEDPAKGRARCKKYYDANAEQICLKHKADRMANPGSAMAVTRRWRKTHPGGRRAEIQARRARKKNAPINDLSPAQWEEIKAAHNHHCVYCPPDCKACKKKTHKLTQDHVTPYAHNGSHTLWNVVPACGSCNSKKHAGPPLRSVQPLLLTIAPSKKKGP